MLISMPMSARRARTCGRATETPAAGLRSPNYVDPYRVPLIIGDLDAVLPDVEDRHAGSLELGPHLEQEGFSAGLVDHGGEIEVLGQVSEDVPG